MEAKSYKTWKKSRPKTGKKKKKRTVQNEPACNDDDTHDICEINCLFIPSSRVKAV